ncbi:phytanoyl-CoA dioxygenase family protein [Inhella proteolytica]|uniref:Phytanoyl-CoA dioxygenase family protein n=1 Tax=Inhella proteolytica TaxID=2795029 RepID=A0A931J2Q8_9BURK|nr:phytanoyl-CoA dioxygenase family protein [Inhella proteolytica]MBH9577226.1 phytanoyl-CoA dioxygenase family protein [Inhella proteolytica]
MTLERDGHLALPGLLDTSACAELTAACAALPACAAGSRTLLSQPWCQQLVARLRAHPALQGLLPPAHRAVQCTLFEKSGQRNWLVPLHQDLSIPVAHRVAAAGLGPWSEKEGLLFVQPPAALLAELLALRLHLDPCGVADGPLQVLPGTHRSGVLSDAQIAALPRALKPCPAAPGDGLLLRPLLLHASSKARGSSRRRVLHLLFGPAELPLGLAWPLAA